MSEPRPRDRSRHSAYGLHSESGRPARAIRRTRSHHAIRTITPNYIADHIRRVLKDGGSAPHSEEVQHFFKEAGKVARLVHGRTQKSCRALPAQHCPRTREWSFVVQVADELFSGQILEEKVFAVFLLENQTKDFGEQRIPALRLMARSRNELGRSRCPGALSAGSDGSRRPGSLPRGLRAGPSRRIAGGGARRVSR